MLPVGEGAAGAWERGPALWRVGNCFLIFSTTTFIKNYTTISEAVAFPPVDKSIYGRLLVRCAY